MTLRHELEPFASNGREAFKIIESLFAGIVAALRRDQRFADMRLQERVPFSGAIGGAYSGDIDIEAQVKARHEFRTLHAWLGSNELLILKADHQNPLVVMPVHLFPELATAAQRVRP